MIAIDTNILVYAHREDSPFFVEADRAITELAESSHRWAIPWPCLYEFYAIVTHKKIYQPPTSIEIALRQIEYWLESPHLEVLSEQDMHFSVMRDTLVSSHCAGGQVHDARIANICIQHQVSELWTCDRDFSRFGSLKTCNPLSK